MRLLRINNAILRGRTVLCHSVIATMASSTKHILILGATGVSGLVFVKHVQLLSKTTKPKLTLYLHSHSKLTVEMQGDSSICIIKGGLGDTKSLG